MSTPSLYRGVWPQNVSKLAKYAVRFIDGAWKVTVLYEVADGLKFLAVEGGATDLTSRINYVKTAVGDKPGGAFYVNEYRHVIVPVSGTPGSGSGSHYFYAGRLDGDLTFAFEGHPLTTKPVHGDRTPLSPGERWVGPRPGIPYVLAAGAGDIYYETPALTDDEPASVRPSMTRKVLLSRVISDKASLGRSLQQVAAVRGHPGGRFYVNEHSAIFTSVGAGDGNGIDYVYCGAVDLKAWFPEPPVPSLPANV